MSYPAKALAQHPGRNPDYRPYLLSIGPLGEIRRKASPINRNRWLPHQGKREMARRAARMAK